MTPVDTETPATNTPAESSPAADTPITVESMSDSERHDWRMTGKLPERTPAPPEEVKSDAASTPAEPAEQATATAVSDEPASKPGKPSKKNAETRKAELASEIQALLEQRDAIRRELDASQRPAPTPAPTPESRPAGPRSLSETIQYPDVTRDPLSEDDFFAQYPDAKIGDFTRYTARYELVAHEQIRQGQQRYEQSAQAFLSRMKADGVEDVAQFWEGIDQRLANAKTADALGPGEPLTPWNVIAQEIKESDRPASLIRHLNEHRADLDQLLALPNAQAIARAVGRLEAKLTATASPPAPAGNPVSLAPAPIPTLGQKPATPADKMAEALRTGDFATYRELRNAEEMRRGA